MEVNSTKILYINGEDSYDSLYTDGFNPGTEKFINYTYKWTLIGQPDRQFPNLPILKLTPDDRIEADINTPGI